MSAGEDELIKKITSKKEFSQLPEKDVLIAFDKFDKSNFTDEEKVKLTRDLLRKVYTAFMSQKLLNFKDKNAEWFLNKHISTKERLPYYTSIYQKILEGLPKTVNVYDLGCGTNGFGYEYFKKAGFDVNYLGVEAVGQIVGVQEKFFAGQAKVNFLHGSLFDIAGVKKIISAGAGQKVVFLFKVIDSLEMLERDYSKTLLMELSQVSDRVAVSFATRSLLKKKKFFADRKWLVEFIKNNFKLITDFEMGSERYLVFSKKDL